MLNIFKKTAVDDNKMRDWIADCAQIDLITMYASDGRGRLKNTFV